MADKNQISSVTQGVKLHPRTQLIIEYLFDNPRLTQRAIAEHFGVSEKHISHLLRTKRVLAAYPILARRRVKSMLPKAVAKFEQLMEQTANLEVSRKVSERVLDTENVLNPQQLVVTNKYESMSNDDLMRVLEQSKQIQSPIIDGELVSDPDQSARQDQGPAKK